MQLSASLHPEFAEMEHLTSSHLERETFGSNLAASRGQFQNVDLRFIRPEMLSTGHSAASHPGNLKIKSITWLGAPQPKSHQSTFPKLQQVVKQ